MQFNCQDFRFIFRSFFIIALQLIFLFTCSNIVAADDENIITGIWNGEEIECVADQIVTRFAPYVTSDDVAVFFAQNGISILSEAGVYDVYLLVQLFRTDRLFLQFK